MQPENFTNMGKPSNYIPNTDIPPQNYPVTNNKQILVLFIETIDELNIQIQLIDYLKFNLESWEVPKQFIVLPEFLYTKTGKIDRPNTLTLYLNNLIS